MTPKEVLNPPRESKSAVIYESKGDQENLLIAHTQNELSIGVYHLGVGLSVIAFFPEPVNVHNQLEILQQPAAMVIPTPVAKDTADALLIQWALKQLPLDPSLPSPKIESLENLQITPRVPLDQPQIFDSKGKSVSLSKQAEVTDLFYRIKNEGRYFSVNELLDIIAA